MNQINKNSIDLTIRHWRAVIMLLMLLILCHQAKAVGGSLDIGFDGDGKLTTQLSSFNESYGHATAIQSDGKIIVVGHVVIGNGSFDDWGFGVTRYNTDGSLDATFGSGGKVVTDLSSYKDVAFAVALQADGKIVVGGYRDGGTGGAENLDFAVVRYNTNGSVDTGFGTGGAVITDFGDIYDLIRGIAIQPDGKIVAAGYGKFQFAVARYTAAGALDATFSGGTVNTIIGAASYAEDVAIQPDGKIVVAGTTSPSSGQPDIALVRYNANGSLDTGFQGGVVTTDTGGSYEDAGTGVALQADGKIVVSGWRSLPPPAATLWDFAVVRFLSNGKKDTGFGSGGIVITDFNTSTDMAYDVAVQKDGKIVAAGYRRLNGIFSFAAARYNINGSLDASFDGDGKAVTAFGSNSTTDIIEAVNLQKDGKIVAAGYSIDLATGSGYFAAARYHPGGYAPVPRGAYDFEGDGKTDISVYNPSYKIWSWKNSSNGALNSYEFRFSGAAQPVPADYDGDWQTDIAVFRASLGTWMILNSSTNTLSSVFLGIGQDVPIVGYFDSDDKADRAVFRPSNGTWYWVRSTDGTTASQQFGTTGDVPVTADFNNDGESDLAVFRPSNSTWYWKKIADVGYNAAAFGLAGDVPVAGDYDGDGKTDLAIFRVVGGNTQWYVQQSTAGLAVYYFGLSADRPTPADYDGDGVTDIAVWRDSTQVWYWLNSSDGVFNAVNFGAAGDIPIPAAYLP